MNSPTIGFLAAKQITTLTFDCYGTLVDWESGVCQALRNLLSTLPGDVTDDQLVQCFLAADVKLIEHKLTPYSMVLHEAAKSVSASFGVHIDDLAADEFVASLASWPLFAETRPVLDQLSQYYRLAIISNIDDSLIAKTLMSIPVTFDVVMTSERARSYKPEREIFAQALQELGEPPECVIHVAEGLCEAIPAGELGMSSVWVRRSARSDDGSGAKPDAVVRSLTEFTHALIGGRSA